MMLKCQVSFYNNVRNDKYTQMQLTLDWLWIVINTSYSCCHNQNVSSYIHSKNGHFRNLVLDYDKKVSFQMFCRFKQWFLQKDEQIDLTKEKLYSKINVCFFPCKSRWHLFFKRLSRVQKLEETQNEGCDKPEDHMLNLLQVGLIYVTASTSHYPRE